MNWNWLGWLLWIAAIVFMIWVTHYIRVKQLMLIAKTKRRFDKKLFARYVVLVVLAIGWLGGMAYLSFFRRVSYDDTQAVKITTEYEALQPEYDIIQAMIEARVSQNITQKELSEKSLSMYSYVINLYKKTAKN